MHSDQGFLNYTITLDSIIPAPLSPLVKLGSHHTDISFRIFTIHFKEYNIICLHIKSPMGLNAT